MSDIPNPKPSDDVLAVAAELGPAMRVIEEEIICGLQQMKSGHVPEALWYALDNLGLFWQLLTHIKVATGWTLSLSPFEPKLTACLENIDQTMREHGAAEPLANLVESELLPILRSWPDCEPAVWQAIGAEPPTGDSSTASDGPSEKDS